MAEAKGISMTQLFSKVTSLCEVFAVREILHPLRSGGPSGGGFNQINAPAAIAAFIFVLSIRREQARTPAPNKKFSGKTWGILFIGGERIPHPTKEFKYQLVISLANELTETLTCCLSCVNPL